MLVFNSQRQMLMPFVYYQKHCAKLLVLEKLGNMRKYFVILSIFSEFSKDGFLGSLLDTIIRN